LCRAATRPNNDAVAEVSQGPDNGKSRKPLPHRTRAVDFADLTDHRGSRLRYFGGYEFPVFFVMAETSPGMTGLGRLAGNKRYRRQTLRILREAGGAALDIL
jgi:hypothetical protein